MPKVGAEVAYEIALVNPLGVVAIVKQVPKGKLITIGEICKQMARNHEVKGCCSLNTGIFIMTGADAVEEARKEGKSPGISYWRTLKGDGFFNHKYADAQEGHRKLLGG